MVFFDGMSFKTFFFFSAKARNNGQQWQKYQGKYLTHQQYQQYYGFKRGI